MYDIGDGVWLQHAPIPKAGSDWRYTLAASAVGQPDADTSAAEVESRLSSSLEGDFQGASAPTAAIRIHVLSFPNHFLLHLLYGVLLA